MQIQPLPSEVQSLLQAVGAPPRLIAHLTLVHDVALHLTDQVHIQWPDLSFDRQAVLFGAATHDIGKAVCRQELTSPGHQHELIGLNILAQRGVSADYARFALSHGEWRNEQAATIEDLLVAFADTIWKGTRDETLEMRLVIEIGRQCGEVMWDTFAKLDDIADVLATGAEQRIMWQDSDMT